ncbi:hypothetical protein D9M69_631640 [compost metagenome]
MGAGGGHPDAAFAFQPFGVGKGYTGNPCTVAAGIDTDHEFTRAVIGVVLMVELLHHHQGLGVPEVRVQYGEILGKTATINQVSVEFNDFVGKGVHNTNISFFISLKRLSRGTFARGRQNPVL